MVESETFRYLSPDDRDQARELAHHIARRDWVLFVGSGVSRPSGLPLWGDLINLMVQRLEVEESPQDPLVIAEHFETVFGRDALIALLQESLHTVGFAPN